MAWISDTNKMMSLGDWAIMNYDPYNPKSPQEQGLPKSGPGTPPPPKVYYNDRGEVAIYDTNFDGIPETSAEDVERMFNPEPAPDGPGGPGSTYSSQPDPWTSTREAAEFDAEIRRQEAERGYAYSTEEYNRARADAKADWEQERAAAKEDYERERADQLADDKRAAERAKELEILRNKFQLTRDEAERKFQLENAEKEYQRRVTDREAERKYSVEDRDLGHQWDVEMETRRSAAEEKRFMAELAERAADRDQRYQLEANRLRQEADLAEKSYRTAL